MRAQVCSFGALAAVWWDWFHPHLTFGKCVSLLVVLQLDGLCIINWLSLLIFCLVTQVAEKGKERVFTLIQ